MKVKTVTGGDRDHLELTPDSIAETADLVFVGTSKFMPPDATDLVVTPGQAPYVTLRVYAGEPRPRQLSLADRDAIDRTP